VNVKTVVEKAHAEGVKVLVSLAGGGNPDKDDWKRVLKQKNLSTFIANIIKYCEENDMDGVDVDIEWNLLPDIGNLYTPFVVELKEALHAKGMVITTALHSVNIHPDVTQESLEAYDFQYHGI